MDTIKLQVVFNFGSVCYVGIKLYPDKTLEECIRLRSADIIGYILNDKYIELK